MQITFSNICYVISIPCIILRGRPKIWFRNKQKLYSSWNLASTSKLFSCSKLESNDPGDTAWLNESNGVAVCKYSKVRYMFCQISPVNSSLYPVFHVLCSMHRVLCTVFYAPCAEVYAPWSMFILLYCTLLKRYITYPPATYLWSSTSTVENHFCIYDVPTTAKLRLSFTISTSLSCLPPSRSPLAITNIFINQTKNDTVETHLIKLQLH